MKKLESLTVKRDLNIISCQDCFQIHRHLVNNPELADNIKSLFVAIGGKNDLDGSGERMVSFFATFRRLQYLYWDFEAVLNERANAELVAAFPKLKGLGLLFFKN